MGAVYHLDVGEIDLSAVYDPDERAPIPLDVAVRLPELGGSPLHPSPIWSVKKLRGAIARGELRSMRSGRALYVTRSEIREFISRCHDVVCPQDSGLSPNGGTTKVVSLTPRAGSSLTGRIDVGRSAAQASINKLLRLSKST